MSDSQWSRLGAGAAGHGVQRQLQVDAHPPGDAGAGGLDSFICRKQAARRSE
jgi:hypothetical protein